jgi:hypothetical protein
MGIIHKGRLVKVLRNYQIEQDSLQDLFFTITGTGPADAASFFRQ